MEMDLGFNLLHYIETVHFQYNRIVGVQFSATRYLNNIYRVRSKLKDWKAK